MSTYARCYLFYLYGNIKGESSIRSGYSMRGCLVNPSGWGKLDHAGDCTNQILVGYMLETVPTRFPLSHPLTMEMICWERQNKNLSEGSAFRCPNNWDLYLCILLIFVIYMSINMITFSIIAAGWGGIYCLIWLKELLDARPWGSFDLRA